MRSTVWGLLFLLVVVGTGMVAAPTSAPHGSTDAEIIERVRWERRIWPGREARPPFEEAVPPDVVRGKHEDVLRKSAALGQRYGRTVTAEDLRLELYRMIRNTRDPGALRAMFAALDDDPVRIAETIARPVVVDRLLRGAYERDQAVHAALLATATSALARARSEGSACPADARCVQLEMSRSSERETWDALVGALTRGSGRVLPLGQWLGLQDVGDALVAWRLEASGGGVMRLTRAAWPRPSFENWWEGQRGSFPARATASLDPGELPQIAESGGCPADTWSSMDPQHPGAREHHTAVWTGSEMIVWGGQEVLWDARGWKYAPATDTWSRISGASAPSTRSSHVAVWTGAEMIVWGGNASDWAAGSPASGGRYDPVADRWTTMSIDGAPSWRFSSAAVWTGAEMIVWGGEDSVQYFNDGGRYSPSTDSWTPLPVANAPRERSAHSAVWTGTEMIVWGGWRADPFGQLVVLGGGGRYSPAANLWLPMGTSGAPEARATHTVVWTGTEMIVWGGVGESFGAVGTGGRYRAAQNLWQSVSTLGAPTPRDGHTAVWTGTEMVVWGGYDVAGPSGTGGRYDPGADTWQLVSAVGAPPATGGHTAVWTGSLMITHGGSEAGGLTREAGRYDPSADAWQPVATTWRPFGRERHAAVWTGNEMFVWGGNGAGVLSGRHLDAGMYELATDTWTPISLTGSPTDRRDPSAVWTGTHVLVWGGVEADPESGSERPTNGGARYDPLLDAWSPMNPAGQPSPRSAHSTVWTGSDLIVWGGRGVGVDLGDGARYTAATDSWLPISLAAAPSARSQHVAVWSGREMLVASGTRSGGFPVTDWGGARYDPDLDLWSKSSDAGARSRQWPSTGVWTGRQLIVFGDRTGERYDLATDAWADITSCDVRLGWSRGIWACGRAVFWGDEPASDDTTGVGRAYDPESNGWSPTSSVDSPMGCQRVGAVRAGTRLLTFGGSGSLGSFSRTGGSYCACAHDPLRVPTLFVDRTPGGERVSWLVDAGSDAYDVVSGDLTTLRATGGDFGRSTTRCLADDVHGSSVMDPVSPSSGEGTWYLARSVRAGESSTYDSEGGRQVGSRDAEVAASPAACP